MKEKLAQVLALAKGRSGMASVELITNPYNGDYYICKATWADRVVVNSDNFEEPEDAIEDLRLRLAHQLPPESD